MRIVRNDVPKPKFRLHDKVCVYTKYGIVEAEILEISIRIRNDGVRVSYYVISDSKEMLWEGYSEDQIFLKKDVKKKINENLQQLKLFELPPNE